MYHHAAVHGDLNPSTQYLRPHPPPNFTPPIPLHVIQATPNGNGFDTYDYPTRFQPQAVQKIKEEAEMELNSPYARPRVLNSPTSAHVTPQGGRVASPYDYPRIKNVGEASSPRLQTTPHQNGFSNPQYVSHTIHLTSTPHQGAGNTKAALPGSQPENTTPQSSAAPYPEASTPQSSITSTPKFEQPAPHLAMQTSEPVSSPPKLMPSTSQPGATLHQPAATTPQPGLSIPGKFPNLSVQIIAPHEIVSPQGSPLLSCRRHPLSPLILNSNSVSEENSPRTSGELD